MKYFLMALLIITNAVIIKCYLILHHTLKNLLSDDGWFTCSLVFVKCKLHLNGYIHNPYGSPSLIFIPDIPSATNSLTSNVFVGSCTATKTWKDGSLCYWPNIHFYVYNTLSLYKMVSWLVVVDLHWNYHCILLLLLFQKQLFCAAYNFFHNALSRHFTCARNRNLI